MSMTSSEMTPADIFAVTCGGRDNNGGGFLGDGIVGLIALIIIGGMFGFGGFGMGGMGGMGGMMPWLLMSGGFNGFGGNGGNCRDSNAATQADVQRGFDQQTLLSKIDQQTYGISNATYDINNTMQNGFSSAELSRCNQQAALMQMLYQMSNNQQDCCCKNQMGLMQLGNDVERGFCNSNYNAATNTTAIIQNAHNDTDRVLAKLDAMEMSRKDETIADLRTKLAACGDQTTAQYIINQLTGIISPRAFPAYPAASPCGLGNWSNQVLANGQNNCGCGNGCGNGCGF